MLKINHPPGGASSISLYDNHSVSKPSTAFRSPYPPAPASVQSNDEAFSATSASRETNRRRNEASNVFGGNDYQPSDRDQAARKSGRAAGRFQPRKDNSYLDLGFAGVPGKSTVLPQAPSTTYSASVSDNGDRNPPSACLHGGASPVDMHDQQSYVPSTLSYEADPAFKRFSYAEVPGLEAYDRQAAPDPLSASMPAPLLRTSAIDHRGFSSLESIRARDQKGSDIFGNYDSAAQSKPSSAERRVGGSGGGGSVMSFSGEEPPMRRSAGTAPQYHRADPQLAAGIHASVQEPPRVLPRRNYESYRNLFGDGWGTN